MWTWWSAERNSKNILHQIPVHYITMSDWQQTVLLHGNVLLLIMTATSTARRERRAERRSCLTEETPLSITKTNKWMLLKVISIVWCDKQTEHSNTQCGHIAELLYYSSYRAV
jgi:hypothetical protein